MSIFKKNKRKKRYTRRTNTAAIRRGGAGGSSSIFKKIFIAFFLFLIFYFVFSKVKNSLSSSDMMLIKTIEINTTQNITKAEIKALLPFKEGDSIIAVDLNMAEKEISKTKPELKSISIRRGWHKISIKAQERTPEAFVRKNNSLMAIDSDGAIFPLRGFMSSIKVPTISYNDEKDKERVLNFILSVKSIDKSFFDGISDIKLNDFQDFTFITNENAAIFWGNADDEDLANKISLFKKTFVEAKSTNKKIVSIDMSLYKLNRMPAKFEK
ncbi:MAG: FtsQ-type POTRA domain-containing protein [Elusimicrobiota bacterium]|jgi:cell division septal protein FtsQ|nr:FtsQ-type POTRA domain-containing protein [Elusimicrobiota bacterium]